MAVKAVFFDVGETLLSESRQWREWAEWLGVSESRFLALQRETIARREHHRRVFEILKPGFDLKAERAKRAAAGKPDTYLPQDLYPDVMDCFAKLRQRGTKLGIAGNQPQTTEAALSAMGAVADVTGSSGRWGCEKPSAEFFNKVIEVADCRPGDIAYVGDRVDHDVVPAHRAGMVAILLRRGPWGTTHAHWPEAALAHVVLESLSELPATIEALRWSGRPR